MVDFNISQPIGADKDAFLGQWHTVSDAVHGVVMRHGGSISAEHGIGLMKRDELPDPGKSAETSTDLVALNGAGIVFEIWHPKCGNAE